ncbi:hypothetical protein SNEBB_006535 [Seison nebaliae]|nr:hypothetical protein SNEBB_006535 [Seison nebaliae]
MLRSISKLLVLPNKSLRANYFLRNPIRHYSQLPYNTVVLFVPQQEAWIIERFGKFHSILQPGLNVIYPIVDGIKYVQSLKEIAIDIPQQNAITKDNVTLNIDGVLYLKIRDAYRASYGVEDAEYAVTQLAQTTMRSELGKIELDTVFKERDQLNFAIVEAINKASMAWGIECLRYEIRDIKMPPRVQEAMQLQVEAERKKRAFILESEGKREAEINVAEGEKRSKILNSEALRTENINRAIGESEAIRVKAEARAASILAIGNVLTEKGDDGDAAVKMQLAEQYVQAFSKLAKESNTILLPSNSGDSASMVAEAMSIYTKLTGRTPLTKLPEKSSTNK